MTHFDHLSDEDVCDHGKVAELCRQCATDAKAEKARREAERAAFRAANERKTIRRRK